MKQSQLYAFKNTHFCVATIECRGSIRLQSNNKTHRNWANKHKSDNTKNTSLYMSISQWDDVCLQSAFMCFFIYGYLVKRTYTHIRQSLLHFAPTSPSPPPMNHTYTHTNVFNLRCDITYIYIHKREPIFANYHKSSQFQNNKI